MWPVPEFFNYPIGMSELAEHLPLLRERIDAATSAALQRACDLDIHLPYAQELFDAAQTSISSGKRFRAIGAYIGAAIASNTELGAADVIDDLAAALELYQASALVHDDVIDHADTRRGLPTPHRTFAALHQDNSWLGNNEQFGQAAAILLGDLLFSAAEDAAQRCATSLPSPRGGQVLARYTRMHTEVAAGQYLDVRAEQTSLDPKDSEALPAEVIQEVIRLKSARYSVVHPMLLGAAAMGASRELLSTIESIIHPWGMAFQMRDDVLGVFGDPDVTGKPAGDDLIEGKRTYLLHLTWKNATLEEREFIASALSAPTHERAEHVPELRDIISRRGSADHEDAIAALVEEGHCALQAAEKRGEISLASADILRELGAILTARKA